MFLEPDPIRISISQRLQQSGANQEKIEVPVAV
jgi:hypothetical protein